MTNTQSTITGPNPSMHGAGWKNLLKALNHRQTFKTSGAFRAEAGNVGDFAYKSSGQLRGSDLDQWSHDKARALYVVWSYATPIAWEVDGYVYRVQQKFSPTTRKHQGKLYALEMPEGYFDSF